MSAWAADEGRKVRCFGVPEFRLENEVRSLSRRQSQFVAALAAAGPNGLDADGVLEALYGEDLPGTGNQAVYSLVNRLNGDASSFIANENGRYRIAQGVGVDIWTFETLVATDEIDALVEAILLWEGRPFDAVEAGEGVAATAERLRRQRSSALEALARRGTASDLRRVERQIHEASADDPFNEPLAIATAGAMYRLGKRQDALSIIQQCRARLRSDLGLDGSSDLGEAELAVLRDDVDAVRRATGAVEAPGSPRSAMPPILVPRAEEFVGRQEPLAQLDAAIASAGSDGRGRVALVVGDAGMGKSELVGQFAAGLEGVEIRGGGGVATGAAAYGAWLRALPELEDAIAELSEANDLSVGRLVFWQEVERCISKLVSPDRPLLVVLEDLHESDRQSALLLGWLASAALPANVLIVGTTRPPETGTVLLDTARGIESNADKGVATMIRLEPLTRDDVLRMVMTRFPSEPAARLHRFADQVHALSQGNPLVGQSIIAASDATNDLATSATNLSVADRHAQSVMERVDADLAGVLTNAALIGTEFELDLLAELCEQSRSATLVQIESAIDRGLILETETLGRFRFDHAMTAEAFAQRASRTRQGETYRRLSMQPSTDPVDRVRYVIGAGESLEAPEAVDRLTEDAAALVDEHAFSEAQSAYEHAVDRLRAAGAEVPVDLLIARAEATARSGDFKTLSNHRREAFGVAEGLGDTDAMSRAALAGLPSSERAHGDHELFGLLERIDQHDFSDPAERGRYIHQFVRAARLVDRGDVALTFIEQTSRDDVGDDEAWALLESERCLLESQLGRDHDAASTVGQLADELPPGIIRTQLRHREFMLALIEQQPDALTTRFDMSHAEALQFPVPRVRWALEIAAATFDLLGMRESLIDGDAAWATGLRLGISDAFDAWGAHMWLQLWLDGRLGEALALIDGAENLIEPNVGWDSAVMFGAARTGDSDRANELVGSVVGRLRANPTGVWAQTAAALVIEAGELLEIDDAVSIAVDVLKPYTGNAIMLGVGVAYLGPVDGFLGRGLKILSDSEADTTLDAAIDQATATGAQFWLEQAVHARG